MSGTVRVGTHGARLKVTIENMGGRNPKGTATIKKSVLSGVAKLPAQGSQPAITITFGGTRE